MLGITCVTPATLPLSAGDLCCGPTMDPLQPVLVPVLPLPPCGRYPPARAPGDEDGNLWVSLQKPWMSTSRRSATA